MGAVIIMFLLGAGIVLGAYYAFSGLPAALAQRRLDMRISEVSRTKEDDDKSVALLKTREDGPLPAIERMLGGTAQGTNLGKWIEQSGVKMTITGQM